MTLIIAEKPSLARNIAAGIGDFSRRNGYLECKDYIITWAFGHLFSLYDVEDYTGGDKSARWSMEGLPCFPDTFKFRLRTNPDGSADSGVAAQFATIKTLCNRSDVDRIANAGDADREGEIIIRLCIQNALKSEKPVFRLWLPDQTPQTVAAALCDMKPQSDYDSLANEGFARTYIDWLYGINLTRYATLKTGVLLRVGRVIAPIVRAIYDRDMSIRNFVPEKYYGIQSEAETGGQKIELVSKKKFSGGEYQKALDACTQYNLQAATVLNKKTKKDTLKPGKLYSLSKLQNVLGKKHKMSMERSLQIVQRLYEQGYLTYPRTNSEYLACAEKDKIRRIIANVKNIGYPVEFKDGKAIFDDAKIESHSALTPTYKIPAKTALSEDEMLVYQTVFRRFVAVFCSEECRAQKTEITIGVGELEQFVLRGTVVLESGWMRFDDSAQKDKLLPPLEKGDSVNIDFKPKEKETSPPKHYTIETLNNYLKNPFREDKARAAGGDSEDDTEEYRAMFEGLELGTEATRTGIIDNARRSKYIELKKDVYYILPDGEYFVESLMQMNISMDKYKTSQLGQALKKVYRGQMSVGDAVELAKSEISDVFCTRADISPEKDRDSGFYGDEAGFCPLCGQKVVRGRYGFGCMGYKSGCKFRINGVICKRIISLSNVRLLLATGKTSKIEGFVSKNGREFSATLRLENDGNITFDFS